MKFADIDYLSEGIQGWINFELIAINYLFKIGNDCEIEKLGGFTFTFYFNFHFLNFLLLKGLLDSITYIHNEVKFILPNVVSCFSLIVGVVATVCMVVIDEVLHMITELVSFSVEQS